MKKDTYRKIVSLYHEGIGESTVVLCILQSVLGNSTIEFREAAQTISQFYREVILPKEVAVHYKVDSRHNLLLEKI